MELHQVRSFVTVAEELHVGRAAVRLHLAQPTLSRQIAALERDVGVPLFSRTHRRFALTSAGEVFLTEARELLRRADQAARDARRAARGELGRLRVGFVQSATYEVLPRLVGRFRSACPDVELEARPMTTLRQVPALQTGQLDAGLLRPQQPSTAPIGLRTQVLSQDSLVAVLPSTHPLATRRRVRLAALAEDSFIMYAPEPGSTGHEQFLDHCGAAGFVPRIVQETHDAQTTIALVAANLGVSLMISPTPPVDPALVTCRPLAEDLPRWEMALAWSEDNQSAALRRLLTIAADLEHG